jgi:hypothetical protein
MGWTLLQNMMTEYSSMNNTEEVKEEMNINGTIRG